MNFSTSETLETCLFDDADLMVLKRSCFFVCLFKLVGFEYIIRSVHEFFKRFGQHDSFHLECSRSSDVFTY